jgi:aminoglycoside phosphotransferase (APT) family kinase protein
MEFVKPISRDLDWTRGVLERWLAERLPEALNVRIVSMRQFPLGQSGDLLNLDIEHDGPDGVRVQRGLVVRVEPRPSYQLFKDTNFLEQYRVIAAVGREGRVPIPAVIGFEANPATIGDRFYVMDRVPGQAGDSGLDWVKALDRAELTQMWQVGLRAMATLHRTDWRGIGLDFLDKPSKGEDALEQQLNDYQDYYDWVRDGETRPVIEMAFQWLWDHKPPVTEPCIVWGDARPGNQLYTRYDRCTAIVDLEQTCLGTAETDLGWWCYIEDQRRRAFGVSCPDLDETVKMYGDFLGRPIDAIEYYIVFAALRIAVLRIKLHILREGQPDQYGRYDGDFNLARTIERFVPDQLNTAEFAELHAALNGTP